MHQKAGDAQVQAEFAEVKKADFDGIFAVGHQLEMLANHLKQALKLVVAQEGRRAAAEVKLRQLMAAVEMWGEQFHFALEVLNISIGSGFVFGDDFVAAAVIADGIAKRNVDIKR